MKKQLQIRTEKLLYKHGTQILTARIQNFTPEPMARRMLSYLGIILLFILAHVRSLYLDLKVIGAKQPNFCKYNCPACPFVGDWVGFALVTTFTIVFGYLVETLVLEPLRTGTKGDTNKDLFKYNGNADNTGTTKDPYESFDIISLGDFEFSIEIGLFAIVSLIFFYNRVFIKKILYEFSQGFHGQKYLLYGLIIKPETVEISKKSK